MTTWSRFQKATLKKNIKISPNAITTFKDTYLYIYTPPKTNMTMENPPFEDVFPIDNGDFPMSC